MSTLRPIAKVTLPSGDELTLETDIRNLSKMLNQISRTGVQRATTRATNKSLMKTRTQARKGISKKFNLPAKVVNPAVTSINMARGKNIAIIQGRGSRIPIYKTKGAKTQKRLGVSVNTGTGRRVIKHTFIGTMPSGHIGIFKRTLGRAVKRVAYKDSTGRTRNKALPISELMFPPMSHMLTNKRTADPLFKFFTRDYPGQLRTQLNHEWDKARGVGR